MASTGQVMVGEELSRQIQEYFESRPGGESMGAKIYSIQEQEVMQKALAGPENDIIPELKQTGWFRDPREEDEKKRFDKTAPMVSHPLSFRELDKYGYGHLVEPIMELGGPYAVGSALGYEWFEPTFEVDETKRPERTESYAMDIAADLSVGGSLEDKLERGAASMDLGEIKRALESKRHSNGAAGGGVYASYDASVRGNGAAGSDDRLLMDYSSIPRPNRIWKDDGIAAAAGGGGDGREPTLLSRLVSKRSVVSVSVGVAFAFGRCTKEAAALLQLDDSPAVTVFQLAGIGLALASVLQSVRSSSSGSSGESVA